MNICAIQNRKQFINANRTGNQQSYIINAICQLKSEFLGLDKLSQDVLHIFPCNLYINKQVILQAIHNAQLLSQLLFSPSKIYMLHMVKRGY